MDINKERPNNFIGFFTIVGLVLLWQLLINFKIMDPLFTGIPTAIFKETIIMLKSREFYGYFALSLQSFLLAFSLAIVFGLLAGLLLGVNKKLYANYYPYLFAINAIPMIALLPLIIVWFGVGLTAKTAVIFLFSVVPIMANTADSAKLIDDSLIKMAGSFKGRKLFILKSIILPGALPYILSGVRVASSRAVIGLLIAEYNGLGKGIGYLLSFYGATFSINKLMALVLIIVCLNLLFIKLLSLVEKRIVFWKT